MYKKIARKVLKTARWESPDGDVLPDMDSSMAEIGFQEFKENPIQSEEERTRRTYGKWEFRWGDQSDPIPEDFFRTDLLLSTKVAGKKANIEVFMDASSDGSGQFVVRDAQIRKGRKTFPFRAGPFKEGVTLQPIFNWLQNNPDRKIYIPGANADKIGTWGEPEGTEFREEWLNKPNANDRTMIRRHLAQKIFSDR